MHRNISRAFVQCGDGSQAASSCTDPLTIDFGYQREHEIGAIKVATDRRRSRVTVRVTGWTGEFGDPFDLLACRDNPFDLAFGPPTTGRPSQSTFRRTLPLKAFTHRTTTIALKRTLEPPADAAERSIPLSTVKLSARITLRRSVSHAFCGPPPHPPDRLFVCSAH